MDFRLIFSILFLSWGTASSAFAGAYDDLSPALKSRVQSGETVLLTQDVAGSKWPRITIYKRIDATPEEAMAVFTDYPDQKNYLPRMNAVWVSKRYNASTVEVSYAAKLPWPVNHENYTAKYHVATKDGGDSYRLDWTLVQSDNASSNDGTLRIEPLGKGAFVSFTSLVVPKSMLAGAVRQNYIDVVRDGTELFYRRIQDIRTNKRDQLTREIQALHQATD